MVSLLLLSSNAPLRAVNSASWVLPQTGGVGFSSFLVKWQSDQGVPSLSGALLNNGASISEQGPLWILCWGSLYVLPTAQV